MNQEEQRQLLLGLMNVRLPGKISGEFLKVQDDTCWREFTFSVIQND